MEEQLMAKKNLIYKTIVGSKLYGTFTEDSDTDYIGVFVPDKDYVLGIKRCEQVEDKTNPSSSVKANTKADVDSVIYSLPKIVHMLLNNNPTALEILFAPKGCIVFDSELGKLLRDNSRLFISKKAKHTYCGYAFAQKNKVLNKKDRYSQFIKAMEILEIWRKQGKKTLPNRLDLVTELVEKGSWYAFEKGADVEECIKTVDKQLLAYGRHLEQVKRLGYDPKFICHVVRLLDEGIQLLTEGRINLPLDNAQHVRDIKMGKYELPEILRWIEDREKLIEVAYVNCKLPNTPDMEAINKLQIQILDNYYRAESPR